MISIFTIPRLVNLGDDKLKKYISEKRDSYGIPKKCTYYPSKAFWPPGPPDKDGYNYAGCLVRGGECDKRCTYYAGNYYNKGKPRGCYCED